MVDCVWMMAGYSSITLPESDITTHTQGALQATWSTSTMSQNLETVQCIRTHHVLEDPPRVHRKGLTCASQKV